MQKKRYEVITAQSFYAIACEWYTYSFHWESDMSFSIRYISSLFHIHIFGQNCPSSLWLSMRIQIMMFSTRHGFLSLIMNFAVMHSIKQWELSINSAPPTVTNFRSSSKLRQKSRPKLKDCVMRTLKLISSEPAAYNSVVKIVIVLLMCQITRVYEMCSVHTPSCI